MVIKLRKFSYTAMNLAIYVLQWLRVNSFAQPLFSQRLLGFKTRWMKWCCGTNLRYQSAVPICGNSSSMLRPGLSSYCFSGDRNRFYGPLRLDAKPWSGRASMALQPLHGVTKELELLTDYPALVLTLY